MRRIAMLFVSLMLLSQLSIVVAQDTDYTRYFGGYDGTFVIHALNQDVMEIYNPARATTRFPPFSTFKVPHTAIALDSGIATRDFVIDYDALRYPYNDDMALFFSEELWTSDHTLETALPNSIVWYYQEMAGLIGETTMQDYVSQFDYGNQDISGWLGESITSGGRPFWLGGSLEISAVEQVLFLTNLYRGNLGLQQATTDNLLDIMTLYQDDDYRMYGKTGTSAGTLDLAWFIGIIEQHDAVYAFAYNVSAEPSVRTQAVRAILVENGYMPEHIPLFQQ